MYLITNEGLKVLEEKGIKEILDDSFKDLNIPYMLFDEDIKKYAQEHNLPYLLEKIEEDEINKNESFIMYSGIIYDLLKDKLPSLENDVKKAISAYYIYYDRFLKGIGFYRGNYLWRDEKFLNFIYGDDHGDMKIEQYDVSPEFQLDLFNYTQLVKKSDSIIVEGSYSDWIKTLIDFITFCCQIKKPVPFKDNWENEFYNGKFEERATGEVAGEYIRDLKHAKEGEKYSWVKVLPFIDNPLRHVNIDKNFYHTSPVRSNNDFKSMPFINKDTLIYLQEGKKGIEVLEWKWDKLSIRFGYEQIPNAVKGIVTCIQKGASRCHHHDPGLVFKYFPYERFNELK